MTLSTIILIIWLHYYGDYFFQPRKIANNKYKNIKYLLIHTCIYCLCLLALGWKFAVVSACLHFLVDFITSKAAHAAWEKGNDREFFLILGIDQSIHITMLVSAYKFFNA